MMKTYDQEFEPGEENVTLKVTFTIPEAGWIYCMVEPLHQELEIFCTHISDPFQKFLNWLEQIASGATSATWVVNEEGSVSRLQFYSSEGFFGEDADFLLHIQTGYSLRRIRGANVDRRQLERFPHELSRQGFPLRRRCDSGFLLVVGGQHGWHERFHRIFGTELSQRSKAD